MAPESRVILTLAKRGSGGVRPNLCLEEIDNSRRAIWLEVWTPKSLRGSSCTSPFYLRRRRPSLHHGIVPIVPWPQDLTSALISSHRSPGYRMDTGCGYVWSPAKQASAKLRDLQGMPRNASIRQGRQCNCLPNPGKGPSPLIVELLDRQRCDDKSDDGTFSKDKRMPAALEPQPEEMTG